MLFWPHQKLPEVGKEDTEYDETILEKMPLFQRKQINVTDFCSHRYKGDALVEIFFDQFCHFYQI